MLGLHKIIELKQRVDISKYSVLLAFLKTKPKAIQFKQKRLRKMKWNRS